MNDLVDMIVAGVRALIEEELRPEPLLRERLIARINEMQGRLATEMYTAVATNRHGNEGPKAVDTLELEASTAG